jgi:hypothetical protein
LTTHDTRKKEKNCLSVVILKTTEIEFSPQFFYIMNCGGIILCSAFARDSHWKASQAIGCTDSCRISCPIEKGSREQGDQVSFLKKPSKNLAQPIFFNTNIELALRKKKPKNKCYLCHLKKMPSVCKQPPNRQKFAQPGHPGANPTIFEFTATTPAL